MISAFALVVTGLGIGQLGGPTSAEAAAPAGHPGTRPNWVTQASYEAVWLGPLEESGVYFTSDAGAPPAATAATVGTQNVVYWEKYGFNADMTQYKIRPVLAIKHSAAGGTAFPSSIFTTTAIARIGGTMTDPTAPLTAYFWANDDSSRTQGPQTCTAGSMPVVRITYGSTAIQSACMPTNSSQSTYPPSVNTNDIVYSYGGESDQYTGNLYALRGVGPAVDSQAYNGTGANTSANFAFSVWDPVTGAYSLSGPIQPGGWSQGNTTVPAERRALKTNAAGATTQGSVVAPSDFALDADGNIYQYVGAGATDSATNTSNLQVIRVEPAKNSNGDIVDGSAANPWRYYVVTKVQHDPCCTAERWESPGSSWGSAFLNGQLFMGSDTTIMGGTAATITSMFGAPAAAGRDGTTNMIKINPLSGTARISASVQNDGLPGGGGRGAGNSARDDASAGQAEVIRGYVYNDANGDGAISSDEVGIPGVTVGIYDGAGRLLGSQTTDSSGGYSFLAAGSTDKTYLIRPVQVQIPLTDAAGATKVNAVQTWGAGSVETGHDTVGGTVTNTAAVQCTNGNITSTAGGQCYGAKAQNTPDPAIGTLDSTSDKSTWLSYATVSLNTSEAVPDASFGYTILGSYGDGPAGPTASMTTFPVHVNGLNPQVWLGDTLGSYPGPVTNDSHGADDGVFIQSEVTPLPLGSTLTLAATKAYPLTAKVSGSYTSAPTVTAWTTGAGTSNWNTTPVMNTTPIGDTATGTLQYQQAGAVTGTPLGQLRAQVSTTPITQPTNGSNQYSAAPGNSTQPWTTNGEIEDYQFNLADAVYRPAATTTSGSTTVTFTDGATQTPLTANNTSITVGGGKAVTAGQSKSISTTVPNDSWSVKSVEALDTITGQSLSTAVNLSTSTSGRTTTILFTPRLGDDITIKVTYQKAPDPAKSTLALFTDEAGTQAGDTAVAGGFIYAYTTVRDADGEVLPGAQVTYANQTPARTTLSSQTCTTGADGRCFVSITSATAGDYTGEVSATVSVSGTAQPVSGSPKTVHFTAGAPCSANSTLSVAPTASGTTTVLANGTASYTATVTAKDCPTGNVVAGATMPVRVVDPQTGSDVAGATVNGTCVTNAQGVCTVTITSTTAGTMNVSATAPDPTSGQNRDISGSPAPVTFTSPGVCVKERGETCPEPSTKVELTTTNPQAADGTAVHTIKATARNSQGGLVGGVTFDFTAAGSALNPGNTSCTTNNVQGSADFGTCTVDEKTTVAGTYPVRAYIGSTELTQSGSPLSLVFQATAFDPTKSTFTVAPTSGSPVVANGTASWTAVLTARDASNNLLSDLSTSGVRFAAADSALVMGPVTNTGNGTYTATLTSTKATTFPVTASYQGSATTDSTKDVSFVAGPVDPTKSQLAVSTTSTDVGNPVSATVTAYDANNNLVPGAMFDMSLTGSPSGSVQASFGGASTTVCTTAASGDNMGKCTVTFTDTNPAGELVDVHARFSGTEIGQGTAGSSPKTVTFNPNMVDPAQSTFSVARTSGNANASVPYADGRDSWTGTAVLKDSQGRAVTGSPSSVIFETSSDVTVGAVTETSTPGTYTVRFTSLKASEDYTVKAVAGGGDITTPSPTNKQIPFVAGPVDPRNQGTALSVSTNSTGINTPVTATATAVDANGNPVAGTRVDFAVTEAATISGNTYCITVATGTGTAACSVTFTDARAQEVQVSARIDGIQITNSPQRVLFTQGGPTTTNSTLSVDKESATVGSPIVATVTARDENNVPVPNYTVPVTVSGSATVTGTCTTNDQGVCTVTINDDTAETVSVSAKVPNSSGTPADITGSPKTVQFTPDVPSRLTSSLSLSKTSATVGEAVTATVTVKDSKNNPVVAGIVVPVTAGGSAQVTGTCTTNAQGVCTVTINDSKAETVDVAARINGENVQNSPTTVTWGFGVIDPDASRLQVSPSTQTAGSLVDVTVTVVDVAGNPVTGLTSSQIQVVGTDTGPDSLPALTMRNFVERTSTPGQYVYQTTSQDVGTFRLVGTVNGTTITQRPNVTFIAGAVCVGESCTPTEHNAGNYTRFAVLAADNGKVANGSAQDVVTAYAYDTYGNPVNGAAIRIQDQTGGELANILRSEGSSTVPAVATAQSGSNGQARLPFTSTRYGGFVVQGTIANLYPATSVQNLNFVSDTVDPGQSSLVLSKSQETVAVAVTATVTTNDRQGNPVGGVTVSLTSSSPDVLFGQATSTTCVTGTSGADLGKCSVTFTSEKAGDYTISASAGGNVKDSPAQIKFVAEDVICNPATTATCKTAVEVTKDNARNNDSDPDIVKVSAFDRFGNAISGATVTTSQPAALHPVTPSVTTATNGTAELNYTSLQEGSQTANLTITKGSSSVTLPATMAFLSVPIDPLRSRIDITPATSQQVRTPFTVTATLRGAQDQLINNGTVRFTLPANVTSVNGDLQCTTGTSGTCSIQINSTRAGTYEIGATAPDASGVQTAVSNSPQTATWTPGPVNEGRSTVEIVASTNGAKNDGIAQVAAIVHAYDADGNPVPNATVASTTTDSALSIVSPIAPTNTDGVSTIYYTSLVVGEHVAAVTVDGKTPSGSPVRPTFGMDTPCTSTDANCDSTFTVTPLVSSQTAPLTVGTEDANKYQVTATVRGTQNQVLQGALVTFDIDPTEGVAWTNNVKTCTTGSNGQCSVTVSSTKSGSFAITATVVTGPIESAKPATWKADAVTAANSFLTVTRNNSVADGSSQNIVTVTARDRFNNAVPGALVASTKVNASDTLTIQGDVAGTNDQGQSTIWYTTKVAGDHQAAVTINGIAPAGNLPSPVTLNFTPGTPSESKSTLEVDNDAVRIGETVTATVTARDQDDNKIGGVAIRVTSDGSSTMSPASPATCTTNNTPGSADFGTCKVTITDQKSETVNVKATIPSGQDIANSPKQVRFGFGDVCASCSLLSVSPTSQTAGADALVRVTVRDTANNGITGLSAAQIAVVGTDKATTNLPALQMRNFAEVGDGVYTYVTTSQDMGTFNLVGTVTIDSTAVTITQKPDVTFTAGDVCVANCTPTQHNAGNITRFVVDPNGKVADGSQQDVVTAYAYDTYGNPVSNAAVRIEDKSTGDQANYLRSSAGTSVGTASTGQDGTAVLRFTSTKSGDFPVEGTIGGLGPDSRSQTLTFVPAGIGSRSALTLSKSSETVDVPVTATAKIVDDNNNPISGVTVTFGGSTSDIKFNGSPTATTATCQTGTNGECTVALTSQKAGSYTVTATAGIALTGSPAPITFTADPTPCVNSTSTVQCESYVEVTKNGALNDGNDQDILTVHVFDRFGNELSGVNVTTTPASSAVRPVVASVTTGADGTAVLRYTSLVKDRSNVTVLIGGVEPKNAKGPSPVELSFIDVPPRADHSRIDISPTTSQTVTTPFTITATIRGAQDQLIEGAGVKFSATSPDVTFVGGRSTCTTDATGTCAVEVVSSKPGTYQVGATISDSSNGNRDTAVQNSPVRPEWTVNVPCLPPLTPDAGVTNVTTVSMTRNGALNDGQDVNVATVRVYDCQGNPISGVTVASAPRDASDTSLTVQPIANTGADGTTQIYYTSLVVGDHPANVTIGNVAVPGSPVTPSFSADVPDPNRSSFTVTPKASGSTTPLTVGTADANKYVVTATIKGSQDQALPGQVATLTISPSGTSWATQQTCRTGTDGTCSVEVHSTKSGTFTVTADTVRGPMVGDGVPAKSAIWKADAADATHSWVEMTTNGATANGNSQNIATVHILDQYDNPVSGERPQSTRANPSDTLTIQSSPDPTNSDGTTTIYYQTTVAGTYNANVLVGGQPVSGTKPNTSTGQSPVAMSFVAGPPCQGEDCPNGSELTLSSTTPKAGDPVTATVTAKDRDGNLVGGTDVVVTVDGSAGLTTPTGQPVGQSYTCRTNNVVGSADFGKCQVTISDNVAEPVTVTAKINGEDLKNSPATVDYQPTCVPGIDEGCTGTVLSEVTVTTNNQYLTGGVNVATVKIYDKLGNPVSDPAYVVTSTPDNSPQLSVGTIPALANGQTQIPYTTSADREVTHSAKVFVKGVELKNADAAKSSPVSLRFIPKETICTPSTNPSCPPENQSSLEVDKNNVEVGTTVTATVTAKDIDGKFVGNVPIEVTFSGEAYQLSSSFIGPFISAFSFSNTCTTNNAGTCQVQFSDNKAETIQVRATIAGADVRNSPLPVTFTTTCVPDVDSECPPPPPGVERTYVEMTRNNQVAGDSARPNQATVHVFDRLGNPVSTGYTVTATAEDTRLTIGTIPALANGQTVIPFTTSNLMDAEYSATVSIRNNATGSAAEIKYVDDDGVAVEAKSSPVKVHFLRGGSGHPDAPVITSPQPGPNNNRPVTVAGTGEPGSTVTLTDKGAEVACTPAPVTVNASGNWTCQVSLPDGDHTLAANVTDPAGNKSPDSDSVQINVDTVKPDKPVVNHPDGPTNDTTPQFDGTAEKGSTVTVKEGDTVLCTATANATTGAWSCSPPADKQLSEDDHTITVTATDPAGNTSDPETKVVTVDTTPPDRPIVNHPTEQPTNDTTPTFDGTAEPGATVEVKDGNTVLCTAVANATTGAWSCTPPDDRPLSEGEHTVTVTATDPAGNRSGETPVKVVIDTTPPGVPVISVANATEISGTAEEGSTVTVRDNNGRQLCQTTAGANGVWKCDTPSGTPSGPITAVATDPAGNNSQPGNGVIDTSKPNPPVVDVGNGTEIGGTGDPGDTITITDPNGREICETTVGANGRWKCDTPANMPSGEVTVVETDPAGNKSDPTVKYVDTDKPDPPTVEVANGTEIGGKAENGSTVTVRGGDGNVICTAVASSTDGSWKCTTPPGTPSGPITVTATDPAGNVSDPRTAVLDTDRPAPPVVNNTDGSVITGTAEPNGTVKVTDANGNPIPGCESVTVSAGGSFSCVPTTPITAGTELLVTVTDAAGNVSDPTRVTVRTTSPATNLPGVGTGGTVVPGAPLAWLGGLLTLGAAVLLTVVARRREEAGA